MNIPDAENRTPCFGREQLFWTPTIHAHAEAKLICDECPFIDWCRTEAQHTLELRPNSLEGTWAGVLHVENRSKKQNAEAAA